MNIILNSILDLCKYYKTNIDSIDEKIKYDFRKKLKTLVETKINLMCCDILTGLSYSDHYFELIEIIKNHKNKNNTKLLNEFSDYLNSIQTNNNELKSKINSLIILSE